MTRRKRILIELLAPAPLGVVGVFGSMWATIILRQGYFPPVDLPGALLNFSALAFYAYIFAGLPSLAYATLLEWQFARGLDPESGWAVGCSTLLGGIAGCVIYMAVNLPFDGFFVEFAAVGLFVGLLIGLIIQAGSNVDEGPSHGKIGQVTAALGLLLWPALAWAVTRNAPPWVTMWAVAVAELYALKLLTLVGRWRTAGAGRVAAYLFLWPGLDAEAFLGAKVQASESASGTPRSTSELGWALFKFGGGLALFYWAAEHPGNAGAPWAGMVGIIFTLHFGLFHVLSWCWRRIGVVAQPLMRAPILAVSVAEFWGERWNVAFAETARRYLLRPLARCWGGRRAGAFVFLVSGLVHETVISLPAGGGWGGPTGYFLLQAAGVGLEKSVAGRQLGLGAGGRGRAWMLLVTLAPLPLLFPAAFTDRVIRPMLEAVGNFLPHL